MHVEIYDLMLAESIFTLCIVKNPGTLILFARPSLALNEEFSAGSEVVLEGVGTAGGGSVREVAKFFARSLINELWYRGEDLKEFTCLQGLKTTTTTITPWKTLLKVCIHVLLFCFAVIPS